MNRFLDELASAFATAAERCGAPIEPPDLDSEVAGEILDLARVAAHTHDRRSAPLAAFLAGAAVERARNAPGGMDRCSAADLVRAVRLEVERQTQFEAPPAD